MRWARRYNMAQQIVQIDAFTAEPYAGNPAAVCVLDGPAEETWMRKVAREMNLSETAFLYPIDGGFHLRWFTPRAEVDLCGHGTLATAHLLFEDGLASINETLRFKTRSGWVSATVKDERIELDFPVNPLEEMAPPAGLVDALGVRPVFVGGYPKGYLVVIDSETAVRELDPDLSSLAHLPRPKVCVSAPATAVDADFVSRLFAPAIGIPEDPVNGNSHTVLTPYWSGKLGKLEMVSHYVSERGGEVRVRLAGDRVLIAGKAVTVMRGTLEY
jgi:PhzF family phenazine biosynthesis protein